MDTPLKPRPNVPFRRGRALRRWPCGGVATDSTTPSGAFVAAGLSGARPNGNADGGGMGQGSSGPINRGIEEWNMVEVGIMVLKQYLSGLKMMLHEENT